MKVKVAVVILNWNGRKFLEQFLPSVLEHSRDDADVIVADNASEDDSVSFLKKNYPEVGIILNKENGGFSKGYNDALKQVEADYYVLLNSDIEVTENWIRPIVDMMHTDEKLAAVQPKILTYHDKGLFEYAGAAGGFIDKYGYPFCRGRLFQSMERDEGQYDDATEVFWATGACMFVRADLYHKLGGLDEDFFAHMEEIDFCWRLKNKGYKIMCCPHSKVYHVGGGTLPKSSSRKTYLNFRNNTYLMYKNLPGNRIFRVFVARCFLDFVAALKFLMQGGFKDFIAVIRAHGSFWKHYKKIKKKRKAIPHRYISKIYKSNIALDYFIKGKRKFSDLDKGKFS
ncbi:MAG: glycosyltransferase family 2 protein [Bacteroidales bacterium]|nr:glycosyltransferase family 2 protein [Bacteroidales bacterium]MCF8350938.1 glycosyltransferase family 2 protein [Bacteroidales bacterium]MCF8377417.1 glycosyltransferase family 2 protein [Bacteroidales bacterium]MCF8401452.1 glycosyltransferase family 2 protein [Bacteroidales bacterium]